MIKACGVTHTGNIFEHNEDNIYVGGRFRDDLTKQNVIIRGGIQEAPFAYAVFDGLGGGSCGEVASYIAATEFHSRAKTGRAEAEAFVSDAHKAIRQFAEKNQAHSMGTTAAVLQIEDETAYVFNVGDSRVYLFRDGGLERLSKDHSIRQLMIDSGLIKESEATAGPYSNDLTQFIGMGSEEEIEPEAYEKTISILPGDLFLLCSDGLTGEMEEDDICELLKKDAGKQPEDIALDLSMQAVKKGKGRDNVSVIIAAVSNT